MSAIEKLKVLNRERKEIKGEEDNCYDWDSIDRYIKLKKKRKKIEKQIFKLINEL